MEGGGDGGGGGGRWRWWGGVDDDGEGGEGADDAGERYDLDASSDDRRGIPVKGRRRPGRGRKVEGDNVEEREEDLDVAD